MALERALEKRAAVWLWPGDQEDGLRDGLTMSEGAGRITDAGSTGRHKQSRRGKIPAPPKL